MSLADSFPREVPDYYGQLHPDLIVVALNEEADHPARLAELDAALTEAGLEQRLATEESRAAFVDELEPETFIETLVWLNGVLTDTPEEEWGLSDSVLSASTANQETGTVDVFEVYPAPEDKVELLGDILRFAQSAPDLELKAAILGYGIGAVHPGDRANGRLARITYYLLTEGYRQNDEVLGVLLSKTGSALINTDHAQVRTKLLQNILLETGAYTIEGGTPVPTVVTVLADSSIKSYDALYRTGRPAASRRDKSVFSLLATPPYTELLPTAAARYYENETTFNSAQQYEDRVYFALDLFWGNASDEDMALYYEIYRETAKQRVRAFIGLLLEGEESPIATIKNESDDSISTVPLVEVMLKSIRRKDHHTPVEETRQDNNHS